MTLPTAVGAGEMVEGARKMTDLEITRLCAEAMDYEITQFSGRKADGYWALEVNGRYRPLEYDAQAMALVKRFVPKLSGGHEGELWFASVGEYSGNGSSLNRAICECCAKMMLAKKGASNDASIEGKAR